METTVDNRAERARALVVRTMPEELCLSLPLPVTWEGVLVDAFFTFSISTLGMVPYPAKDCRIVLPNGEVIIDAGAFGIDEVAFDTSADEPLLDWGHAYQVAYDNYDEAFESCASGTKGSAASAYVAGVRDATPASQLPYYVAMNPWLFSEL